MKTRTQLELWKVVKDNFDEYFKTGLCDLIFRFYLKGIISRNENVSIRNEIERYGNSNDYFLGEPKNPKPRLEFIDKMIKKYEQLD